MPDPAPTPGTPTHTVKRLREITSTLAIDGSHPLLHELRDLAHQLPWPATAATDTHHNTTTVNTDDLDQVLRWATVSERWVKPSIPAGESLRRLRAALEANQ